METSPLICSANQWTGFYMISASVMKGLRIFSAGIYLLKLNNKKLKEQCVQYVKR